MKRPSGKYLTAIVLIWIVCAAALLLAYIALLSPQRKTKKQLATELAEKKQLCEAAEGVTADKNKKLLATELEDYGNLLKNFAVDDKHSTDLTFDISKIANNRRVSSFSIGPEKDKASSKLAGCSFIAEERLRIGFRSSFNDFAALLNDMERHHPTVFIDDFTITRSDEGTSLHQVDMTLAVFVRGKNEVKEKI